jgi:hypothetical protein
MPAVSEKQRRFMGAELGRLRAGEKTRTGMSEEQLRDYAKKGKARKHGQAKAIRES